MSYKKKILEFIMDGEDIGKRKALRYWLEAQEKFLQGVPVLLYRLPLFFDQKENLTQKVIGQYRIYTTSSMSMSHLKVIEYLYGRTSITQSKKNESLSGKVSISDMEKKVNSQSSLMGILYDLSNTSVFIHDGIREAYSFRLIDSLRFDTHDGLTFSLSTDLSLLFLVDYRINISHYTEKFPSDIGDPSSLVLRYLSSLPASAIEKGIKLEKALLSTGTEPWPEVVHKIEKEVSFDSSGQNALLGLGVYYNRVKKEFLLDPAGEEKPEQFNPYVLIDLLYGTFRQDSSADTSGTKLPINFKTLTLSEEMRKEALLGGIEDASKIFEEFKRIFSKLGANYGSSSSVWRDFIRKHPEYAVALTNKANEEKEEKEKPSPRGPRMLPAKEVKAVSIEFMKKDKLKKDEIEREFLSFQEYYKTSDAAFITISLWATWLSKYVAWKEEEKEAQDAKTHLGNELYLARLDSAVIVTMLSAQGIAEQDILDGKEEMEGIHFREASEDEVLFYWNSDEDRTKSIQQYQPESAGTKEGILEMNDEKEEEVIVDIPESPSAKPKGDAS